MLNDEDQHRVFDFFQSQSVPPAVPDDSATARPKQFSDWQNESPSYQYQDRCRVRLRTPIYELPKTGDPLDDFCLPYIIVYLVEFLEMPQIPESNLEDSSPSTTSSDAYQKIPLSKVFKPGAQPTNTELGTVLIATFPSLVRAEVHALWNHATFLSSFSCVGTAWSTAFGIIALTELR